MKRAYGFGLAVAGILGSVGCGASVPATGSAVKSGVTQARAADTTPRFGHASGWVGQKSLRMSFFSMFCDGRYGDQDTRIDMYFGNRVRGTVGDVPVELSHYSGQLHGTVGKYPVYATYYNGSVSAYNGTRYLSLREFGRGFSGWVGHWSVNVSWLAELTTIEKVALVAVMMTEMVPTP